MHAVAGKLANQPVKPLPVKPVSHGLPSLPRPRAHILSCLAGRFTPASLAICRVVTLAKPLLPNAASATARMRARVSSPLR